MHTCQLCSWGMVLNVRPVLLNFCGDRKKRTTRLIHSIEMCLIRNKLHYQNNAKLVCSLSKLVLITNETTKFKFKEENRSNGYFQE